MKKKPNVVQLNNAYIQDEHQKRRYEEEETRRRNRFMGWILVGVMLLFILPTYNVIASYISLQERQAEVVKLEQEYKTLSQETADKQSLAERLKNEEYVEKYARAKYNYSFEGEVIYPLPEFIPK